MLKLIVTLDLDGVVKIDLEHATDEERGIAHRFYEYLKPALDELDYKVRDFAREENKK